MNTLQFVQSGGTIDKDYLTGGTNRAYHFVISDPAYGSILRQAEIPYPVGFTVARQKDSSDPLQDERGHNS